MKTSKLLIGGLALAALGVAIMVYKRRAADEDAEDAEAVATAAAQAKADVIAAYQQKEANPILQKYPAGTLLRMGSNDAIYIISELGQRQWISSRDVFDQMHLNLDDVKPITQEAMSKIPIGPALAGLNGIPYLLI